ncbi:MAG: cyclohexanecarboxylate-CoA ligase [Alcaligenaceae bacterium]|nr:cyclohexanecarboxylate-CoA ligase [Alcaligenaceae bacterium]HZJ98320.1 cyclohexanecarboxylate-CoA ligase [Oligella sp.]
MEFDAVLIQSRRASSVEAGLWHDKTINDYLDECLQQVPDKLALSAKRSDTGEMTRFTYRELSTMADRIAVGLSKLGVGRNDVVACQLPNSWQFSLIYLACSRIGAVMSPLMHIFRERELRFMLNHSEAKVVIVPAIFRGFNFEQMHEGLAAELPHLQHLIVVDGAGDNSFEALLSGPEWEKDPAAQSILTANRPGPDDVTQVLFTSGTTGEPKGVMHTANTTMSNVVPYVERLQLGSEDVVLMASPMAHQTGFLYGLIMPIMYKMHAVLLDVWNAEMATNLIREEKVTFTMASTPFLTDLAKHIETSNNLVPTLRTFVCAGAPIPSPLVEMARRVLGTKIISAWGMTENGAVTVVDLNDPDERTFNTDGKPLRGVEIKIVDTEDHELPRGESGRLLLRACSNFAGYLKRPELNDTTEDGWFDTGDLAYKDEQGYIRITGRSKDVIIRGGENIPVVEIESLLYRHPAVELVAIVAFPDERLGERACAVVTLKQGQTLSFEEMVDFLKEREIAIQYIPERLLIRDSMPATPSGKLQKFRLREILKEELFGAG